MHWSDNRLRSDIILQTHLADRREISPPLSSAHIKSTLSTYFGPFPVEFTFRRARCLILCHTLIDSLLYFCGKTEWLCYNTVCIPGFVYIDLENNIIIYCSLITYTTMFVTSKHHIREL